MSAPSALRPGSHFKNGKLIRFGRRTITVLRAWPDPMAWRKTLGGQWRHVRPKFALGELEFLASGTLLEMFRSGEWVPRRLRGSVREPLPAQARLTFAASPWERMQAGLLAQKEAAHRLLETIPQDVRSLVAPFPQRQWHVLVLLARVPGSADLVRSNPALAFAIASSWVFQRPPVRRPVRAARRLVRIRRRDAAGWLGFPPTESAARILSRVPAREVTLSLLLDLRRGLVDPGSLDLLRHLRRPTRGVLVLLCNPTLRDLATSRLLDEISSTPEWTRSLRAYGMIRDTREMALALGRRSLPFESIAQLVCRHDALVEELNRGGAPSMGACTFPAPPLRGGDGIEPITTPDALAMEGREMGHCCAARAALVVAGRCYLYRVLAPERATLEIVSRDGRWCLGDVRGPRNASVRADTRDTIRAWLRESGGEAERAEP